MNAILSAPTVLCCAALLASRILRSPSAALASLLLSELYLEYAGMASLPVAVSETRTIISIFAIALLLPRVSATRALVVSGAVLFWSLLGQIPVGIDAYTLFRWQSCILFLLAVHAWAALGLSREWFFRGFLSFGVVVAAIAALEYFAGERLLPSIYFASSGGFRSASLLAHPLILGWFGALLFFCVIDSESRTLRLVGLVAASTCVLSSGSRSAVLAVLVAYSIATLRCSSPSRALRNLLFASAFASCFLLATGFGTELWVRVTHGEQQVNRSQAGRIALESLSGPAWVYGHGPGYISRSVSSGVALFDGTTNVAALDNQWMTILAELGPIVFVACLVLFFRTLRRLSRRRARSDLYLVLLLAVVSLTFDFLYWPVIGGLFICCGMLSRANYSRNSRSQGHPEKSRIHPTVMRMSSPSRRRIATSHRQDLLIDP